MQFTKTNITTVLGLLGFTLAGASSDVLAAKPWRRVDVPSEMTVTLPDGSSREVSPSCSGGPTVTEEGIVPADDSFAFFVQPGASKKILLFMDGGGACWDALTCIGTPLQGNSSYSQMVTETVEATEQAGGVLDGDNSNNPFKTYTKVFVPYCTGDIHYGSRDTFYQLPPELGGLSWTIKHRGVDNLQATMHMLNTSVKKVVKTGKGAEKKNRNQKLLVDFSSAEVVMVTGSSAGGYGATLAFPYVAEQTNPRARMHLISDAAIGVQTQEFFDDVIYNARGDSSWGVVEGLPSWVPAFSDPEAFLSQASADAENFQPLLFRALSDYRPDSKLASITTNFDGVQLGFYGVTRPGVSPVTIATDWYTSLQTIVNTTAATPNYRFFVEDGEFHTFLADDAAFYGVGSLGISVRDWINNMIKKGRRDWNNLDAGPPAIFRQ